VTGAEMLDMTAIARALRLAEMGHELMKWLGDRERAAGPSFDLVQDAMSVPEAAREWVTRNYAALPARCRPPREELASFANLVGTYLETSFELVPGRRRFEGGRGCHCTCCAALADMSSLKTKTLDRHDKEDARKLMRRLARDRAQALGRGEAIDDAALDRIVADARLREPLAMVTWARELLARLEGRTAGAPVLALCRMFAWRPTGSPKPDFAITADAIAAADAAVVAALEAAS